MSAVGIGALIPGRVRVATAYAGAGLAALFWVVNQNLGLVYSGQSTDPNTGVLLILFAAANAAVMPAIAARSETSTARTVHGDEVNIDRIRQGDRPVSHIHSHAKKTRNDHDSPTSPLLAAIAITACLLAAGCSSSKDANYSPPVRSSVTSMSATRSATASQAASGPTMRIKNFGYTVSGTTTGGSTVMVTNNDGEAHTVTADSGAAFDVMVQPGRTASFVAPTVNGTYRFHCKFHSNNLGTLTDGG